MNVMVVAQTVVALAEALAVARASGAVDQRSCSDVDQGFRGQLRRRNHGIAAVARYASHPRRVPDELHHQGSLVCARAGRVRGREAGAGDDDETPDERTMEAGYRDNYYTAVIRTIAGR